MIRFYWPLEYIIKFLSAWYLILSSKSQKCLYYVCQFWNKLNTISSKIVYQLATGLYARQTDAFKAYFNLFLCNDKLYMYAFSTVIAYTTDVSFDYAVHVQLEFMFPVIQCAANAKLQIAMLLWTLNIQFCR